MSGSPRKIPHYMEGTKVSRMRETYNREKYMKSFHRSQDFTKQPGIRAFKNFKSERSEVKKANKIKNLIDDIEDFPAADDYMREVQYILNNRSKVTIFNHSDNSQSYHKRDADNKRCKAFLDYGAMKPNKNCSYQKSGNNLENLKTFGNSELLLPMIGSKRNVLNRRSITAAGELLSDFESFKLDRRPKNSGKLKNSSKSINICRRHKHENLTTSPSSDMSSVHSAQNTNRQPQQDQLSKTSSSLGNLLDVHSSFSLKFPAISKTIPDSKAPNLTKVPDILCNLPPARNIRMDRDAEAVNLGRCISSTRSVDSRSFGISDKKENITTNRNKSSFHETKLTDTSIEDNNHRLSEHARNIYRLTQKRLYSDHTFSSLQKIPPKKCDFKTLPSKRFSFPDKAHPPMRESSHFENRNLFRYHKPSVQQLQFRNHSRSIQQHHYHHHHLQQQHRYHHHHHHQQQHFGAYNDQHSANDKLNSKKLNNQSSQSLKEKTYQDDEIWKRERICEWVCHVNMVAQHPPLIGEIKDEAPQTAFLVIHQGDDDDDDFLDSFC